MEPKYSLRMVGKFGLLFLALAGLTMRVAAQTPVGVGRVTSTATEPDPQTKAQVAEAYGKLPLSFEANRGQTDPQVNFLARGRSYTLFLTNGEAVLALASAQGKKLGSPTPHQAAVRMGLTGANPKPVVSGIEELPGKSNYFVGKDPGKWKTDVPNYARVRYQEIYPGIDLIYYGNQGQLEYDFLVAPGSDPKAITLNVASTIAPVDKRRVKAASLRIDRNGDLLISLNREEIRFQKPIAYQEVTAGASQEKTETRKFVQASYVLKAKNKVGIQLSAYDRTRLLVIDPVVWYSSYLGGNSNDQAAGIAVDASGNAYVAGFTTSSNFPRVNQISGACVGSCGRESNDDAFVTKISASGKALIYSSYLGGSGNDEADGIAVDSDGNAYLTGTTGSFDFPRVNQISGSCLGACGSGNNFDAFVTKINAAGNALVYSSLVGGSGDDGNEFEGTFFAGIAVDGSGNAYLTGTTFSTDFPRVNQIPGACLGSCGQGTAQDVFVTKVNAAGSALVYSSYLGSSGSDLGFGIAVDLSGNVYLAGLTLSSDFPRVNQIAGACNGECSDSLNYDAYITKINTAGSALVYSSYLGGSGDDSARGIAVDGSGNAYLAGSSGSTDFPVVSQIPGICALNSCGGFVTKVNAAGSALVYSSRFGGSNATQAHAIAVDDSGSAYVTGENRSADFPRVNQITGACRGSCGTGANQDGFVTKIDAAGDALVYSSYIGGSGDDNGGAFVCNSSVAVDSLHNAYLSGCTLSADFPQGRIENATPSSIPGACGVDCGSGVNIDAFVMKISP